MSYFNGNYIVRRLPGGGIYKRVLRINEDPDPLFPDSIDLKITNSCNQGCPFCHENSNPEGKHFNLQRTINILSTLPEAPIELAIGGGNIFNCSKDTLELINWAENRGFKTRITISLEELKKLFPIEIDDNQEFNINRKIYNTVKHTGVSILKYEKDIGHYLGFHLGKSIVWHTIVGITPIEEIQKMLEDPIYDKILILGFKQFGRAINQSPYDIEGWRNFAKTLVNNTKTTIGFDNLAVEQLGIKELLSKETWESFWLGPEFSSKMYVDAVEGTFAPTSRSINRVSWNDISLLDYFNKNKNVFSN